jgi:hypothetical protein
MNMIERGSGRRLAAAYAATIFPSAFLLFQVQPLIGQGPAVIGNQTIPAR